MRSGGGYCYFANAKFSMGFREMFALLGNVLQLLDKRGGGVLQWLRKEKM